MTFQIKDQWTLTAVSRKDKTALIKYISDKEIADNTLTIPYPYTEGDANWWFNNIEKEQQKRGRQTQWAIRTPEGEFAGSIGITLSDKPHFKHRADIGYWIGKPFRNQGITSRAIRVLSDHFLQKEGFTRLQAHTYSNNIASGKALEKAGFTKEGVLRKSHFKNGVFLDSVAWGKVK